MATCRRCRAPIYWAETAGTATRAGRPIPLEGDPDRADSALRYPPDSNPNMILTRQTSGSGNRIARFVSPGRGAYKRHECPNGGA